MKKCAFLALIFAVFAWTAAAQEAGAGASASGNAGVFANQNGAQANSNSSISTQQNASTSNGSASASSNGSVAAGTAIPIALDKSIDAKKAKAGDQVSGKVLADVRSNGRVVVAKGSKIIGHITEAKARQKGDSDSDLGIAFDQAKLKGGETVALHAIIQAVAAAPQIAAAPMADTGEMEPPSSTERSSPGVVGSTVGAATNTVGAAGSAAGRTAGTVGENAGATVGGVTQGTVEGTANTAGQVSNGSANGALTSATQGVVGLPGVTLNSAASNAAQVSVISSSGKDVKLDSGTRMVLRVVKQ